MSTIFYAHTSKIFIFANLDFCQNLDKAEIFQFKGQLSCARLRTHSALYLDAQVDEEVEYVDA